MPRSSVRSITAVAILGIIAAAVSRQSATLDQYASNMDEKIERLSLNRQLIESVDCNLTAAGAPTPCPEGTYVDVKSLAMPHPVIINKYSDADPSNATTIGKFAVRAKCGPAQTLVFEAKRLNAKSISYAPLFPDVPFGCVMP